MLGVRTGQEGWRYHVKQQELRDFFWGSFYQAMGTVSEDQKELIEVARLVGLSWTTASSGMMLGSRFPPVR